MFPSCPTSLGLGPRRYLSGDDPALNKSEQAIHAAVCPPGITVTLQLCPPGTTVTLQLLWQEAVEKSLCAGLTQSKEKGTRCVSVRAHNCVQVESVPILFFMRTSVTASVLSLLLWLRCVACWRETVLFHLSSLISDSSLIVLFSSRSK